MRKGFYPKLAFDGIRKNKRVYLPYILTCIGMVMMQYIIAFIQYSDTLLTFPGAGTAREMIGMGGWVIAVFAGIFLFYTNSFLIRHRKKEFGLYNILGMDKKNIGRILFWENLMIAAASMIIGLVAGIAFSKFAELGLVNLLNGEISYKLTVSFQAVVMTAEIFTVIFILLFLNGLRQVRFSSVISLIRSENVGEKPPKGNWFLGIAGVLILGAAYYLAVSIQDPLSALLLFFAAAVMVIVGTYLLMIAGSVLFCRMLQKKKNYYYKANHFVSVSSMVYRMKRNGAGLASICILATMVLVMISSTATLYIGSEDTLNSHFPKDFIVNVMFAEEPGAEKDELREEIQKIAKDHGITPENATDYVQISTFGRLTDNVLRQIGAAETSSNELAESYRVFFVSLDDYNRQFGKEETLDAGEALIFSYKNAYQGETFQLEGGNVYQIKKEPEVFFEDAQAEAFVGSTLGIVVPDLEPVAEETHAAYQWQYAFNPEVTDEEQISFVNDLKAVLYGETERLPENIKNVYVNSRAVSSDDYYGLFGGLFYLGIILSIVFVIATVLIIYYKQISEGYEDQSRFEIMQKVGMTKKEIRRTINSQLLTVFFLPLVGAGIHLTFAFPLIRKMLLLFNLNNVALFAGTTAGCFVIFGLFYGIVYRMTSNAYYKIVSGAKED